MQSRGLLGWDPHFRGVSTSEGQYFSGRGWKPSECPPVTASSAGSGRELRQPHHLGPAQAGLFCANKCLELEGSLQNITWALQDHQ